MRLLHVFAILFLVTTLPPARPQAVAVQPALLRTTDLGKRFLLQVNYEQKSARQDFRTSRSRIVMFDRERATLHMRDVSAATDGADALVLATIPIRLETGDTLDLDLNAGFDTVDSEEDRTGEDYFGRIARHDDARFRL